VIRWVGPRRRCLLACRLGAVNIGYIKWWRDNRLQGWSENEERKAGGFDPAGDVHSQHLTMTGMSSFLALTAEVVYQLKTTGKVVALIAHTRILGAPGVLGVPSVFCSWQGRLNSSS